MKKKAVSTEGLDRYEALAKALGADATRMFGMPVLKAGGKVFAGFDDGAMTFKLDAPDRERALALPGAAQFDPGMGRPMKEWVRVPAAAGEEWESLARSAQAYVRTKK